MRIRSLHLSWFRGAAIDATLPLGLKSMVVYGENGTGKSSFVDGIEYILNEGRIGHLAHEYSGRRQEKAIINTHIPQGDVGKIKVILEDNSEVFVSINRNGNFSVTPEINGLSQWVYQHTILRQNEVANFIADTKGGKYSSLLPLLGLQHLEVSAENLRQLERSIIQKSDLLNKKAVVKEIKDKEKEVFQDRVEEALTKELSRLNNIYCGIKDFSYQKELLFSLVQEILKAIESKIKVLSSDQRKFTTLLEIAQSSLKENISSVRESTSILAQSAEPLITERLNILHEASNFATSLNSGEMINCPACGSTVSVDSFQDHIKEEEDKLKDALGHFNTHRKNISILCDTLRNLKQSCDKPEIKEWKAGCKDQDIEYLSSIDVNQIRATCTEEDLNGLESHLYPLLESANTATNVAPPEVQELLKDKEILELLGQIINSEKLIGDIAQIDALVGFISELQSIIRETIRVQSTTAISAISGDIAGMWETLHPMEQVENVHLYIPTDTDKAIEIALKFFGIDQPSPRLTLSEGHRNSLGLCIFLATAKHNADPDAPIFLDDVVVSFDRNHRGMVAKLLEKEFSDRQVILFTHDREWFIELKHQLNASSWEYRALMPWIDPEVGIRWSLKDSTFDDARALLEIDPSAAGNTARKIMDISLALISEQLKIKLPYLHRERNDHRDAHNFLEQIISDSPTCFKIKREGKFQPYTEATDVLRETDRLLVSWANRASHSFNIVKVEANGLIDTCEKALNIFRCAACDKLVTKCDDSRAEIRQCECGELRWCYGKA